MAIFFCQIGSPKPRSEVLGAALASLNKPLRQFGYKLDSQTPESVVWRRSWFRFPPFRLPGKITMSLAD